MRRLVVVTTGLALFVLGVAYLNMAEMPEVTSYMVLGGEEVRPGEAAVFRVSARQVDSKRSVPVEIRSVLLNGKAVEPEVEGRLPALARVPVPADADDEQVFVMEVAPVGQKAGEELQFALPPVPAGFTLGSTTPEPPKPLPEVKTAHRVDLLPEGGDLVAEMENRVFVRVRDKEGRAASDAVITVRHKTFAEGKLTLEADGSGLASFTVSADQMSFRFGLTVDAGGERTETESLLRAYGRQMFLHPAKPAWHPGEPVNVTLTLWRPGSDVFCDLLDGDALVDYRRYPAATRTNIIELGRLGRGFYRLQCYDHPTDPGETWATTPLIVADGGPLDLLDAKARELGNARLEIGEGTDEELASAYLLAALRRPPRDLSILVSTRESAVDKRLAGRKRTKTQLLGAIGLVFLIVVLLVVDTVVRNIVSTRHNLREAQFEALVEGQLDDELDPEVVTKADSLIRPRGVMIAVVLGVTLVLNVVALIWLMAMIR